MDELIMFEGLFTFALVEFILLILMLLKTPAWKFLRASLGHRMVLIHPRENRYVEFIPVKQASSLGFVKGRGYYVIDPKDVYIEGKSKVPCAIIYGNFALTLDLKMAKLAERLKALGLKCYEDLIKLKSELASKGQGLLINLLGESTDMSNAIEYFNSSERSDFIEAEIQRRTASQIIAKLRQPGDLFKWAVIAVIILIGGAIAYVIVIQAMGGGGAAAIQQVGRVITQLPGNVSTGIG